MVGKNVKSEYYNPKNTFHARFGISVHCDNSEYFTEHPIVCDGKGPHIDDDLETLKCCNSSNPCSLGKGHCESDEDCYGGLKCGRKNCNLPFPSNANCCYQSNSKRRLISKLLSCARKNLQ